MTNRKFLFDRSLVLVIAISSLMMVSASLALGQTETVLYNFTGGADGVQPRGVVFDGVGNLFGTTMNTVFELSPNSGGGWTLTTLYTFSTTAGGLLPNGGLIFDKKGNLYGTTYGGGQSSACKVIGGCGVVFKLSPSASGWVERVLYSFTGNADGLRPSRLTFDSSGNLYGTTYNGGDPSCNSGGGVGCGTVFQLSHGAAGWNLTVLHTFSGGSDGADPPDGVIFDGAGHLYGTTVFGGNLSGGCYAQGGCGVVFGLARTSSGGWKQYILHTFSGQLDGSVPEAGLTLDTAGNLYGSTYENGHDYCGTVFELSPTSSGGWHGSTLYAFHCFDGWLVERLTVDAAGNLYGATAYGGITTGCVSRLGCGVVFKLSPSAQGTLWTENVLHLFTEGADGALPTGGVVLDPIGNLYGTALLSTAGWGNVYEITP